MWVLKDIPYSAPPTHIVKYIPLKYTPQFARLVRLYSVRWSYVIVYCRVLQRGEPSTQRLALYLFICMAYLLLVNMCGCSCTRRSHSQELTATPLASNIGAMETDAIIKTIDSALREAGTASANADADADGARAALVRAHCLLKS